MRQRVGCSVCRLIPNMLLPVQKPDLEMSESVLFKMKQVLEGPLWEMLGPFLSPPEVLSMHTSAKKNGTTAKSTDHLANSSCSPWRRGE